ncbi:MAG: AAA family ATPase [Bacteroidales bacterium]|nr:AAA family ATPase [Bacteroidales bacterium]
MELLYLLIEDCSRLGKHKEVSFGGEFHFSISNFSNDQRELQLNITKPNQHSLQLFSPRISNIIGIIGENGTGKTSFFEFLKRLLTGYTSYSDKFLAVFKSKDVLEIYHTLYDYGDSGNNNYLGFTNEWSVKVICDFAEISVTTLKIYNTDLISPQIDRIENLTPTLVIYYSGIFDLKGYPYSYSKSYIDLSTNCIISDDVELERDSIPDKDFLFIHKHKNTLRQFKLVKSGLLDKIDFRTPERMTISFAQVRTSGIKESNDISPHDIEIFEYFFDTIRIEYTKIHGIINRARNKKENESLKVGNRLKCKLKFVDALIANFFYNINDGQYYGNWSKVKIEELKMLNIFDAVKHFFNSQIIIDKQPVTSLIETIFSLIDSQVDVGIEEINYSIIVSNETRIVEIITNYEAYLKSFDLIDTQYGFLEIDWRDLSSGEKAFLDLFSRLYYTKELVSKQYKYETQKVFETVYLLLDEAEIGFHPEWQRKYIYYLNEFLNYLFSDGTYFQDTKIQLFIATHSPFVVSDLPKSNLIFLKKTQEAIFNVHNFDMQETFGANIHTLFSDAFFLQQGLIGEFAKIKIFELMNEIKQLNDPDVASVENYKLRIGIIGEPMIRQRLYELLLSKVAFDDNARRRAFLQDELDKLKRQNN